MNDSNYFERTVNTDIIDFLQKYSGFTFVTRGSAYRCRQHPSLAVKNDRCSWYWHSKGIGGFGAVDFLMKTEQKRFRESLTIVDGIKPETAIAPLLKEQQQNSYFLPNQ